LLDGTERLGVIDIAFDDGPVPERTVIVCECYAHLTAMLIATKAAYGDIFEVTRRREPMNDRLRAAVAAHTAPRLRHRSPRPRRDAGALLRHGGDALDYAVNDGVLHVGIFDAMGHGLAAAGVAAFALSAYRHSHRRGCGLLETYAAIDTAVRDQFPGDRYVDGRYRTTAARERAPDLGQRGSPATAGHPARATGADTVRATRAAPLGIPLEGRQRSWPRHRWQPCSRPRPASCRPVAVYVEMAGVCGHRVVRACALAARVRGTNTH
jgi:hypothetical protein